MLPPKAKQITDVAGLTFDNLYYDLDSNQFYSKRRGNTNCFWPIMWKHVLRHYINKNGLEQNKLYKYINLYDLNSKKRIRLSEGRWNKLKKEYFEASEASEAWRGEAADAEEVGEATEDDESQD